MSIVTPTARAARTLPEDVGLLSWLADELGIAESTAYRLASTGQLAEFGVFRVGAQYRVSKTKANHKIRGDAS